MESPHDQNATDVVNIIAFDSVDSTNSELVRMCAAGPISPWTVVVAGEQTAGRGRLGRTWQSDPGAGMWASVVVDLDGCPQPQWLPLMAGLSLCTVSSELTGAKVGVKWPNDVVLGERKLAGILTEALPGTSRYIVGMGLNFDTDVYPGAVGVRELMPSGYVINRDEILLKVIHSLRDVITSWRDAGWDTAPIRDQYVRACVSIGAELVITEPSPTQPGSSTWRGYGHGVDPAGHLVVREHESGSDRTVVAADVVHATIAPCTPKNS